MRSNASPLPIAPRLIDMPGLLEANGLVGLAELDFGVADPLQRVGNFLLGRFAAAATGEAPRFDQWPGGDVKRSVGKPTPCRLLFRAVERSVRTRAPDHRRHVD